MKIVLNESELIHRSLESKAFDEKNYGIILRVLAKHYFLMGMDKQQVKDTLAAHIRTRTKKYIHKHWNNRIDYAIKSVKKYGIELVQIKEINVTKKELARLISIKNHDLEKIAFVYLIYAKILNIIKKKNDSWVGIKIKDILSDALIYKKYKSTREQQRFLRMLNDMGLLKSSMKVDNTSEQVCFIDETSESIISITDFRNYVLHYQKWKGDKIGHCESCRKLIYLNKNVQKYCTTCAKNIKNEQNKQYYKTKK